MYWRFKNQKKGFTLVEIMIVVAVIGILAVVLIPKIGGLKDSAKNAGVLANVRAVQSTIEQMNLSLSTFASQSDYDTFYTELDKRLKSLNLVNPYTGSKVVFDGNGNDYAVSVHKTSFSDIRERATFDWDHFDNGLWGHYVAGGIMIAPYKANGTIEIALYDMGKDGPLSSNEKIVRINP